MRQVIRQLCVVFLIFCDCLMRSAMGASLHVMAESFYEEKNWTLFMALKRGNNYQYLKFSLLLRRTLGVERLTSSWLHSYTHFQAIKEFEPLALTMLIQHNKQTQLQTGEISAVTTHQLEIWHVITLNAKWQQKAINNYSSGELLINNWCKNEASSSKLCSHAVLYVLC